jgi:hypothetical protein
MRPDNRISYIFYRSSVGYAIERSGVRGWIVDSAEWLKVLVTPGASLGGARPKASFSETNGSLWIAKFPAADDARDVGAWEALAQRLAARPSSRRDLDS